MTFLVTRESDGVILILKIKSVLVSIRLQLFTLINPLAWYSNGNSECGCGSTRIFIFEIATMCPASTKLLDLMIEGQKGP